MEPQLQLGPSHKIGSHSNSAAIVCTEDEEEEGDDLDGEEKELTGVGRRGRLAVGVDLRRGVKKSEEDGVAVDLVAWEDVVAARRRPWRGVRERGVEDWSEPAASVRGARTGRRCENGR